MKDCGIDRPLTESNGSGETYHEPDGWTVCSYLCPCLLKVDWSHSVCLVSPCICHGDDDLTGTWPPWDETAAAYFLPPFLLLPKDNRKEMKERGCFLFSCIFLPFILLVCPSFFPPLFLSLFLSHTCTNTLCKRRLRTDWIIPFVISKGFLLQRLKKIPSKTFPRSSKTFNKGIYRLYFLFTAEIILLSQRTIW